MKTKPSKNDTAKITRQLAFYRRLAGLVLLAIGLIFGNPISQAINTYYRSHGLLGASSPLPESYVFFPIIWLLIGSGLFLVLLGRDRLLSRAGLGKVIIAVILTLPLSFVAVLIMLHTLPPNAFGR